jgi:hypothetical protein
MDLSISCEMERILLPFVEPNHLFFNRIGFFIEKVNVMGGEVSPFLTFPTDGGCMDLNH